MPGKPGKKSSAYLERIKLYTLCDTSSLVPVANPICNAVSLALILLAQLYKPNTFGCIGAIYDIPVANGVEIYDSHIVSDSVLPILLNTIFVFLTQ